ncbi:MAG: hypothetical protein AAGF99_16145 [Bacteroidota bacterium]
MPTDPSMPANHPSHLAGLARLRGRVEAATREIERLREENIRLAERIAELEMEEHDRPTLPLEGDRAAMRSQVQRFLATVDTLLAQPSPNPAASDVD